jgi:hypothetical protein
MLSRPAPTPLGGTPPRVSGRTPQGGGGLSAPGVFEQGTGRAPPGTRTPNRQIRRRLTSVRAVGSDSRASVPACTAIAGVIRLASIPGEDGSSPGPPPPRGGRSGRPDMRRRLYGSPGLSSPACYRSTCCPSQQGGGHPAPDTALIPEKPPHKRGTTAARGAWQEARRRNGPVETRHATPRAGWVTCPTIPPLPWNSGSLQGGRERAWPTFQSWNRQCSRGFVSRLLGFPKAPSLRSRRAVAAGSATATASCVTAATWVSCTT